MYSRISHRWRYSVCALHAGYSRLQAHTQNRQYLMLFPLQRWLHERAWMLRYTHTTCLVEEHSQSALVSVLTWKRTVFPSFTKTIRWMLCKDIQVYPVHYNYHAEHSKNLLRKSADFFLLNLPVIWFYEDTLTF